MVLYDVVMVGLAEPARRQPVNRWLLAVDAKTAIGGGLVRLDVLGSLNDVGLKPGLTTVLLTGGHYSLIDMLVPPGGGPPLQRHDLEECSPSSRGD